MPKLPKSLTETFTLEPQTQGTRFLRLRMPKLPFERWGHGAALFWVVLAAGLSGVQPEPVQHLEQKMQAWFQQLRGKTEPPSDLVILAIDDESISYLGQAPPLPRQVYAQVINRIMGAGAKAIALDLMFPNRSSFGSSPNLALSAAESDCNQPITALSDDDRAFLEALKRYGDRVVIGTTFHDTEQRQAQQTQLKLPYCPFQQTQLHFGNLDFVKDKTDRISQFGHTFFDELRQTVPEQASAIEEVKLLPFADAALQAAKITYPKPLGSTIFFYDQPGQAFRDATVPLSHILDDENWNSDRLQRGQFFKDKLVIVGVTNAGNDIQPTSVGEMYGVELHTHAIATLWQGRSLYEGLPNPWLRGFLVGVGLLAVVWVQSRVLRPLLRLAWAGVGVVGWNSFSYALFNLGGLLLPTALPMIAIGLTGISYLTHGLIDRQRQQKELAERMQRYDLERTPLEILQERQAELQGKELSGRYRIIQILGSGGFGETYVAEDIQRPQNPRCVVKQLHPQSHDPRHLKLASRLFKREAEALEKLGSHEQIPRLLAYFEEDEEFYLVQEYIPGRPLSEEFTLGRQFPEAKVMNILRDLLQVLTFVHGQGVIHRDIKPSNIIQQDINNRLVLIDFGAVKALHDSLGDGDRVSDLTIGIGTQGYMAPEQCMGQPRLNSDLYAVGMVGIQALTGLPPSQLKANAESGEIEWQEFAQVSSGLSQVLNRLIHYDFKKRYQQASEVLQELKQLSVFPTSPEQIERAVQEAPLAIEAIDQETRPWPAAFGEPGKVPPTEPPPTQPSPNLPGVPAERSLPPDNPPARSDLSPTEPPPF
jgi:serine/threonine protein kinase/CHASE2 domain-containing sensor protein